MGICPLFIGVEMCENCPCHVGTKFKASGSHWGTNAGRRPLGLGIGHDLSGKIGPKQVLNGKQLDSKKSKRLSVKNQSNINIYY